MRTVILALLAFAFAPAFAQYDIENPYVANSTCPNIKIGELHVYPDKIQIDFVFEADAKNGGFRYSSGSYIEFSDYNSTNKVQAVKNADYNNFTYLKIGKKANFSATFPFSFYDMLADNSTSTELSKKIQKFPFLQMNIINCSESFLKYNTDVSPSNCFNFYGVDLGLGPDQVEALYLCGLLDEEMVKDEFETTAAYTKRTSPDSLGLLLKAYINDLERIYTQKQVNYMSLAYPTISYDADKELFTIEYTNCEPFFLKMPIAQAPAFKKAIQARTTRVESALIIRKPDGRYYIKGIRFDDGNKEGKKGEILNNATVEDVQKYYDATVKRVLGELKKIYAKGEIWK